MRSHAFGAFEPSLLNLCDYAAIFYLSLFVLLNRQNEAALLKPPTSVFKVKVSVELNGWLWTHSPPCL